MTELAEFLLARIAEDEAVAGRIADDYPFPVGRALAECEAKRRIVTDYEHLSAMRPGALLSHAEFVARTLALPYADHPDFREEWKP